MKIFSKINSCLQCRFCDFLIDKDVFDYFLHMESHMDKFCSQKGLDDTNCLICDQNLVGFSPHQQERHFSYHIYTICTLDYTKKIKEESNLQDCEFEQIEISTPQFLTTFKCHWKDCEYEFNKVYWFYNHINSHPKTEYKKDFEVVGSFKCLWQNCQYSSTYIQSLERHMLSHSSQKNYICQCNSGFFAKFTFIDHLHRQVPENDIPFDDKLQCKRCFKVFKSKSLLLKHSERHVNFEKCPFCDFTGNRKDNIKTHIRWKHSNERPFSCTLCDFSTVSKYSLKYHMEHKHEDEEETSHDFKCDLCDFSAKNKLSLGQHLARFHKISKKKFECHICLKIYARGYLLTKHYTEFHKFDKSSLPTRFQYILHPDGLYRLSLTRLESVKVTQELMIEKCISQEFSSQNS